MRTSNHLIWRQLAHLSRNCDKCIFAVFLSLFRFKTHIHKHMYLHMLHTLPFYVAYAEISMLNIHLTIGGVPTLINHI